MEIYICITNEQDESTTHTIFVAISGQLASCWGGGTWNTNNYTKVLLQIAKTALVSDIVTNNTLTSRIDLTLQNQADKSPFNPDLLVEPNEAEYEIEVRDLAFSNDETDLALAFEIIELRDVINNNFKKKYRQKLLTISQERNLIDFFKPVSSLEEFTHRLASLAEVSRLFNTDFLSTYYNGKPENAGSVNYFIDFLKSEKIDGEKIISYLKQIGNLRNGYPSHSDNERSLTAHKFFGLEYPVKYYSVSWKRLLDEYKKVLEEMKQVF